VLDDHGIRVAELEFVADWLDEPRVRQSEERLYAASRRLRRVPYQRWHDAAARRVAGF